MVDQLLNWLVGLDQAQLLPAVGGYVLVESAVLIGLVLPSDAVLVLAGATAPGVPSLLLLGLVVVCCQLAGESLTFLVGSRYGHAVRRSRLGRRVGEARWQRAEETVRRRGTPALVLAHFAPVAHELMPLVSGTLGLPYRRFLAASAAGSLLWAGTYLSVGYAAGASYRELGSQVGTVVLLALIALGLATLVVRTVRRRRAAAQAAATQAGRSTISTTAQPQL